VDEQRSANVQKIAQDRTSSKCFPDLNQVAQQPQASSGIPRWPSASLHRTATTCPQAGIRRAKTAIVDFVLQVPATACQCLTITLRHRSSMTLFTDSRRNVELRSVRCSSQQAVTLKLSVVAQSALQRCTCETPELLTNTLNHDTQVVTQLVLGLVLELEHSKTGKLQQAKRSRKLSKDSKLLDCYLVAKGANTGQTRAWFCVLCVQLATYSHISPPPQ
jgi:hypothetical protein